MTVPDIWQVLRFNRNRPDIWIDCLAAPGRVPWPASPAAIEQRRGEAHGLRPDLARFIDCSILASLLLGRTISAEAAAWCAHTLVPACGLDGLDPGAAIAAAWQAVPVVLAGDRTGNDAVRFFLVGRLPTGTARSYPSWLAGVLEADALQGVDDAIAAARARAVPSGFVPYLVPLLPVLDTPQVHGRSLALPLALACRAAIEGTRLAPRLVVSGDLAPDGTLRPVDDIPAKARALANAKANGRGYDALLFPKGSHLGLGLPDTITPIDVATLDDAWMWATLYTPERRDDLVRLQTALQGGDDFAANLANLPADLLEWLAAADRHRGLVDVVLADAGRAARLLSALESCLADAGRDLDRAAAIARLAGRREDVERLAAASPVAAFTWSALQLCIANHRGDNAGSSFWKQTAAAWLEPARRLDPGTVSRFVNRQVVADRHNCFRFQPELPEPFAALLAEEERYHRPGTYNYVLGSMYGTVCQNFGFCGPEYIEKTRAAARRAQECFLGGEAEEEAARRNWRRPFAYLVFACLDAGLFLEARANLWRFLGIDSWSQLGSADGLDPWSLFPLCRYLADAAAAAAGDETVWRCGMVRAILDRVTAERPETPAHPWQLIAYEAGRLARRAGDPDLARGLWERAIGWCGRIGGETPAVMALLPLAARRVHGGVSRDERDLALDIRRCIDRSAFLDKGHFAGILARRNAGALLDEVHADRHRYFPFAYR